MLLAATYKRRGELSEDRSIYPLKVFIEALQRSTLYVRRQISAW